MRTNLFQDPSARAGNVPHATPTVVWHTLLLRLDHPLGRLAALPPRSRLSLHGGGRFRACSIAAGRTRFRRVPRARR